MKYMLLSISVLWLGIHWCSGHSLSKIELKEPTELVYKVHEDKDGATLTISNPNLKKPSLREIIYYHIIEKPFGKEDKTNEEPSAEEGPDDEDLSRKFTNGQGYQFLPTNSENDDQPTDVQLDVRKDTHESNTSGDDEVPQDDSTETASTEQENAPQSRRKRDVTEDKAENASENKPKTESLRRVRKTMKSQPVTREKRTSRYGKYFTKPPRLSKLNIKKLPEYIKYLLSRTTQKPVSGRESSKIIPEKDDTDGSEYLNNDNTADGGQATTNDGTRKNEDRTYGMTLFGKHGTVWNNLNNRHYSFNIGDLLNSNEDSNENGSDSDLDSDSGSNDSESGSSESNSASNDSNTSDSGSVESPENSGSNSKESQSNSEGESVEDGTDSDENNGSNDSSSKGIENSGFTGYGNSESGSGESTSASGESTSASGESTSASEEGTSASGESTSASGEGTSASGEGTNASGEGTGGSGEDNNGSQEHSDEKNNESYDQPNENTNTEMNKKFDQILTDLHDIFVKGNATVVLPPNVSNKDKNFNVLEMLHNIFSTIKNSKNNPTPGVVVETDPNNPNGLNILQGMFTNVVKNNIIVNNNVPADSNQPDEINSEKDKTPTTDKLGQIDQDTATTHPDKTSIVTNSIEDVTKPTEPLKDKDTVHPGNTVPGKIIPNKENNGDGNDSTKSPNKSTNSADADSQGDKPDEIHSHQLLGETEGPYEKDKRPQDENEYPDKNHKRPDQNNDYNSFGKNEYPDKNHKRPDEYDDDNPVVDPEYPDENDNRPHDFDDHNSQHENEYPDKNHKRPDEYDDDNPVVEPEYPDENDNRPHDFHHNSQYENEYPDKNHKRPDEYDDDNPVVDPEYPDENDNRPHDFDDHNSQHENEYPDKNPKRPDEYDDDNPVVDPEYPDKNDNRPHDFDDHNSQHENEYPDKNPKRPDEYDDDKPVVEPEYPDENDNRPNDFDEDNSLGENENSYKNYKRPNSLCDKEKHRPNKKRCENTEDHVNKPNPTDVTEATNCPVVSNKDNNSQGEKNTKLDYMLELMNNEKFWTFMGNLGAKYLESLTERTTKFIKEEIAAQVDKYFKEHKPIAEKEPLIQAEKEPLIPEHEPKEHENHNKNISGEKDVKEPTSVEKDSNETTNNETQKTENNKIVGAEKHKKETQKSNNSVYVKANTVYGNTVGNDKVTNVYIFYANKNMNDIMKNIKSLVNGNNSTNIFTFGPHEAKGHGHVINKNKNPVDKKHDVNDKGGSTDLPQVTEIVTESNPQDFDVKGPYVPPNVGVDKPVTNSNIDTEDRINKENDVTEEPIPNKSESSSETTDSNTSSTLEIGDHTEPMEAVTETADSTSVVTGSEVNISPEKAEVSTDSTLDETTPTIDTTATMIDEPVTNSNVDGEDHDSTTEVATESNFHQGNDAAEGQNPSINDKISEGSSEITESNTELSPKIEDHNESSETVDSTTVATSSEKVEVTTGPTAFITASTNDVDEPATSNTIDVVDHDSTAERTTESNLEGGNDIKLPVTEEPIPSEIATEMNTDSTPEIEDHTESAEIATETIDTITVDTGSDVNVLPGKVEITTAPNLEEQVTDSNDNPVDVTTESNTDSNLDGGNDISLPVTKEPIPNNNDKSNEGSSETTKSSTDVTPEIESHTASAEVVTETVDGTTFADGSDVNISPEKEFEITTENQETATDNGEDKLITGSNDNNVLTDGEVTESPDKITKNYEETLVSEDVTEANVPTATEAGNDVSVSSETEAATEIPNENITGHTNHAVLSSAEVTDKTEVEITTENNQDSTEIAGGTTVSQTTTESTDKIDDVTEKSEDSLEIQNEITTEENKKTEHEESSENNDKLNDSIEKDAVTSETSDNPEHQTVDKAVVPGTTNSSSEEKSADASVNSSLEKKESLEKINASNEKQDTSSLSSSEKKDSEDKSGEKKDSSESGEEKKNTSANSSAEPKSAEKASSEQ